MRYHHHLYACWLYPTQIRSSRVAIPPLPSHSVAITPLLMLRRPSMRLVLAERVNPANRNCVLLAGSLAALLWEHLTGLLRYNAHQARAKALEIHSAHIGKSLWQSLVMPHLKSAGYVPHKLACLVLPSVMQAPRYALLYHHCDAMAQMIPLLI